ncbi:MAG TPA: lactonase family protein [Ligilactobacillus acidipiscis]|uniref:Lactonase family protein n=1 Tax=Ligilactobacillus acidipiscis TaxID=89059 RepID=A0A921F9B6_9LACO|nr:lactonase family protein [Ligilactobacillus acidipiscis]
MKEKIFFGTYTRKTSQGIYQATLDTKQEKLSQPQLAVKIGGPTYLRLTSANDLLAVTSQDDQGGISSYQITAADFTKNNDVLHPGASPCYIGVDNKRQLVYSANYHKGQIIVYKINEDHTLSQTDSVTVTGQGPREEQDSAHVHFTDLTPDGRLVAVDLGSDKIYTYDVSTAGKLTQVNVLETESGYGPRHLVFSPNGKYAYLAGELSSQISTLKYKKAEGAFEVLQTLKTIPADWTKHNGAAAIKISSDGKFVYVSNRGYNSLAVFEVQADQHLQLVQQISTEGDFPRDFAIDKTEKFIVCANQNTDNVTLYARDSRSGQLTCLQKDVVVPEGVCVCFADQA